MAKFLTSRMDLIGSPDDVNLWVSRNRNKGKLCSMWFRTSLSILLFLSLSGCSSLGYYAQSIGGHLDLMGRSRTIDQLLVDPATGGKLRQRLQRVQEIRRFATEQLRLPDNDSYRSYADLERKAVVWSVVATPQLSMKPMTWCYPFIGCAAYRGYFSRQQADVYAGELRLQGLDVTVEAVPAYSTLGWFDDPLPSTVIDWPEPHIAGLIFHELAHQQLYVKGDSAFNEAFAATVERVGVERWLISSADDSSLADWAGSQERKREFISLLLESRQRLIDIYTSALPEDEKRSGKQAEFSRLRTEYSLLKGRWGGGRGYDHWFQRELNNARLASIATYEHWVPSFLQLMRQAEGDMESFYQTCKLLGALPEESRHQRMNRLAD
ncbi:MAG: aminopeptidase [Candidatus Sedimenticola sp. (ex Thyasira tokunagai)]